MPKSLLAVSSFVLYLTLVACQVTTRSPATVCYQEALAADSELNECNTLLENSLTNQPGHQMADRLCVTSGCAEQIATAYHCCGETEADGIFNVPTALALQHGCARDGNNNLCGDLIDPVVNMTYASLIQYATGNCTGTDCSDPDCETAIQDLGCCVEFVFDIAELPNVTRGALESCNVERCSPVPFTLPNLPCGGESPTTSSAPLVIALSLVLLLTVVQMI